MYKARYFPNVSFVEAELGSNPSYVWRSLLKARDIVLAGSKWKVGSGALINIFGHQWLPRPPCLCKDGPGLMKVRELVDLETGQWDRAKLAYWFEPHTCADILSIPMPNRQPNDTLVWKENKANVFSVKSAYMVALRVLHPSFGDHSNAIADGKLWKAVWSLNAPPKVRTFLWRACSNILPTRDNLHTKRVHVASTCSVCNQQAETGVHILWECPFARNVWALVKGKIQKSSAVVHDFFLLTRSMMQRLTRDELTEWAMITWAIWNARNKFCFEDSQAHPTAILRNARSLMHEYQTLVANQRT